MNSLKLNVNTILHTRDGSIVGNGIIIDKSGVLFTVKTDYGNVFKVSEEDLFKMFNVAPVDVQDAYSETHKYSVSKDLIDYRSPELFKKRRLAVGLTQMDLSSRLGLKTSLNVSRFENGYISSIGKTTYNKAMKVFDLYEDDEVLD